MKIVSQEYKDNISTQGRELDSKITFGNTELGSNELNSVTPHFEGDLLKSVMKGIEIDSNIDIPVGTVLTYQFGVLTSNGYEYINYGEYVVKSSEKQENERSYLIKCFDKMLYSMKPYESLGISYPISVKDYLVALCRKLGLEFKLEQFANQDKMIPKELYLDEQGKDIGYTYRDVFDELSAVIGENIGVVGNQIGILHFNDTKLTLNEKWLKNINVKFGKKFGPINSVVLNRNEDKIYKKDNASITKNGLCEIEIKDNQILNGNDRDIYLQEIFNKVNGLEYYLNDFESTGITFLEFGDRYNVKIENQVYPCLMLNDDTKISQGIAENIYTDEPKKSETDYTTSDTTDRRINQTTLIVDKQNQKIQGVIQNVDSQNTKISKIEQDVGEIKQSISEIADITTSGETSYATLELSKVNQSEPIGIKIRPINENISYLYPRNNLYPSNNLFSKTRTLRFHNKTTNQNIDYILPNDLLYFDTQTYDEFILDYDMQICKVIKRVQYNTDGTTSKLAQEQVINYTYPTINLTNGDYTVSLLGYDLGYLMVRLMAENIYTTQFATKVELNSSITQTANSITQEVNGKINGLDNDINAKLELKVDTNNLVSEINASADVINLQSNRLIINSDNFKLSDLGKITSISGKIGGWNIEENRLWCEIKPPYDYAEEDLPILYDLAVNDIPPTPEQLQKYDLDGNGKITIIDYVRCYNLIKYNLMNSNPGKIILDTSDWFKPIKIINSIGEVLASFGVSGVESKFDDENNAQPN